MHTTKYKYGFDGYQLWNEFGQEVSYPIVRQGITSLTNFSDVKDSHEIGVLVISRKHVSKLTWIAGKISKLMMFAGL